MDKFLFKTKCVSIFLGLWVEIWHSGKVSIKCDFYECSPTQLLISNLGMEQSQK